MKPKEKKKVEQQKARPALRIKKLGEGQCLIEVGKMAKRDEEGFFGQKIPVYRIASVEEVVRIYEEQQERHGTLTEKASRIFTEKLAEYLAAGGGM